MAYSPRTKVFSAILSKKMPHSLPIVSSVTLSLYIHVYVYSFLTAEQAMWQYCGRWEDDRTYFCYVCWSILATQSKNLVPQKCFPLEMEGLLKLSKKEKETKKKWKKTKTGSQCGVPLISHTCWSDHLECSTHTNSQTIAAIHPSCTP